MPTELVRRASTIFSPELLQPYLEQLQSSADRGDGLLFYSLATDLMRRAYTAWFAGQGRYWPHEKRLQTRFASLGRPDLAEHDRAIWASARSRRPWKRYVDSWSY